MDVDLGEMVKDSRFIGMQLSSRGSRALSDQGLTPIQAHVLLFILKHSERGTSLTEIHREMGYSMAATSGLIKRLREKGFVRVEPYKLDERKKLLFATEKGETVRESMDNLVYRGFTEEEIRTLDCLQKKMLRNLSMNNDCCMEG